MTQHDPSLDFRMDVVPIGLAKLRPYPKNPRTHSKKQHRTVDVQRSGTRYSRLCVLVWRHLPVQGRRGARCKAGTLARRLEWKHRHGSARRGSKRPRIPRTRGERQR
jgi:hypothetical protein